MVTKESHEFVGSKYDMSKLTEAKSEVVEVYGQDVRVWENPNAQELQNLLKNFGRLRGSLEEDGTLYVWDAYMADHSSIEDALTFFMNGAMRFYFEPDNVYVKMGDPYAVLKEPALVRALKGAEMTITEAPISDINMIGDFSKSSSFKRADDRKLLSNPKAITKIKSMWKFPEEVDYNIILINHPDGGKAFEEGEVSKEWIAARFPRIGGDVLSMLKPDEVNIIYTNNRASQHVPLTGWVMAHRFGHALMRFSKSYYFKEARQTFQRYILDLIECYGVNNAPYENDFQFDWATEFKKLLEAICTFRSAREGKIRNAAEVVHEMLAQLIVTGDIKMNDIPQSFKYGHTTWSFREPDYYDQMNRTIGQDLPYEMKQYLETAIHQAVGKIYVM